ncbi:MAG: aldehyde dehydrogenase family protein, partial [Planctomycetota bacterium]
DADSPITKELVTHAQVRIVDYTGSSAFGTWIEHNATQATVYAEKAGVNSVIVDSVDNLRAMTSNLAFTLSLYSGQMCTTSQNIFIPRDGIMAGGEHVSFDDVAGGLIKAINGLLGDNARACEVLGAIQSPATAERIEKVKADGGTVLRDSEAVTDERFPEARIHSPLIIKVDASDKALFEREMFGPVTYIIATNNTTQSIELASSIAAEHGAITAGIYSTDTATLAAAEDATAHAGVPLSCNLVGGIYVNQAAAFSDYHVTGCNPAGNATLCDAGFITGRFHIVQSRVLVPVEATAHAGV